jgi:hypothetical protein
VRQTPFDQQQVKKRFCARLPSLRKARNLSQEEAASQSIRSS